MWLAGGLAVVAACVVVVAVAFLEDDRRTVTPVRRGHVSASEPRTLLLGGTKQQLVGFCALYWG